MADCPCFESPLGGVPARELGMDHRYAEVSLLACPECEQVWMRYLYEDEGFSGSGRWFLGAITWSVAAETTAATAQAVLEQLEWYFFGGSYFSGRTGRSSGPLTV